jgi:hypothetical protein
MSTSAEAILIDDIASFTHDPLGYVKYAFPWEEEGELEKVKGPRNWQQELFEDLGKHLQNPETRHQPFLAARASGHGIGKSAFIGMLVNWGMSTCEDCKVVITANTETQLRTKTMPEISTWFRRAINAHWWTPNAMSIASKVKGHEKSWRADAVTWSINNTEAFAGLHNVRKRIIVVFDEASAIDDKVWEVTEGALTDEETEIIWVVFGNPTRNTGKFKECFGKKSHRWNAKQIDSRSVEGTNKVQIQKWLEDYGEDSDFFKIRVRGMFPSASMKQFINLKLVDAAYGRELKESSYSFAPKILTVDPAWEGDDEFVIGLRQGLNFEILRVISKNDDDVQMASLIAQIEDENEADAVFIDAGYGTGILSAGKAMGRKDWKIVWFSGESNDPGCLNKRAEMWKKMREWLREGGAIPEDPKLHQELITPETVSRVDGKIQLESKKDMKHRGVGSPGRADALALSFAFPVASKKVKPKKKSVGSARSGGGRDGWMGRSQEFQMIWLRGRDSNPRPLGYEPSKLPTALPRFEFYDRWNLRKRKAPVALTRAFPNERGALQPMDRPAQASLSAELIAFGY